MAQAGAVLSRSHARKPVEYRGGLRRVACLDGLYLLDFHLFTDTVAEREQAVWRFEMRDERQPKISLGNVLQMNLIELNKADRLGLPEGPLRACITFFKHWQEELTMANVAHEPVKKAMNRIRELSANETTHRLTFAWCQTQRMSGFITMPTLKAAKMRREI